VKPRHDPVHGPACVDAPKKALDLATVAHNELRATPFDQRRPPENQSLIRTGEAEIIVAAFAQAPEVVHHVYLSHNRRQ
jgi:hypothetical protein